MEHTAIEGLESVKARISRACAAAGRPGESVALIAVSKTVAAEAIAPVLAAGQRHFGENRVQEATAKWPALRQAWADLTLHLIGPLQTNKVRDAVRLFDVIQSLDRDKLASEIGKETRLQGRQPKLFVQVNIGEEPQKAGVSPGEAADFVRRCQETHGLAIEGLMCIPPADKDPRPYFGRLGILARESGVGALSMGMSDDFETAIALGATHVRVGSAIFGARGLEPTPP